LRSGLEREEYEIEQTSDAGGALDLLGARAYAVAVLDQAQRGSVNGLQLAQDVRTRLPWMGIVMCVAVRDAAVSWRALSGACDDYLVKPYRMRELVARVRAVAVRSSRATKIAGVLDWGPLRLDFVRQSVHVHGRETSLQPLQLRLLGYLVQHAGRRVSHDELRKQVFRVAQRPGSTSLARQVSVLRCRLGAAGSLIVTVPGGYGIGIVGAQQR
jgi:DNA-binding response OmpR family regulator